MKKVKNTIPVYDICTLSENALLHDELIAEPFEAYLASHPDLYFPHRHSFFHLVLFTGGSGTHTIDFEEFTVTPGQVYFMIPGQVHTWNFDGTPEGYIINFSEHLFHQFLADAQYPRQFSFFKGIATESVLQLPANVQTEAIGLIETMIRELGSDRPYRNDLVRCALVELFIAISRVKEPTATGREPLHNQLVLQNFLQLTDKYFAEKRLPKEYAALLYITPNHLNALCQDLLGTSAGEIIRNRILLEAKRLLVNLEVNVAEIAVKLNFTDSSYFTKFFRKYAGVTPEEFRKANHFQLKKTKI